MNRLMIVCFLCAVLAAAVCLLTVKILSLRKSAREICGSLAEKLNSDTNTPILLSSGDAAMRSLADTLNRELANLRAQKHRFVNGDREIREAVTNISHDLRTPLTAISGYLELLEREELGERAAAYLEVIQNRTNAMKELTEELFRYSVLLLDEGELSLEDINLTGALEEAVAGMYGAFTSRGITPQITVPKSPVICAADKNALHRILNNILNNALKYSDGDLAISLSKDREIRFSNCAKNLSHVDVGRLFDRFYTVDNSRRSTGLGLSIAKHLAERMGAELSAVYQAPKLTVILRIR